MTDPTREELGDLLRRLVDTAVQMKERAERAEAQLATARAESDELTNQLDSARHSVDVLEGRVAELLYHPAPAPSPEAVARAALEWQPIETAPQDDGVLHVRALWVYSSSTKKPLYFEACAGVVSDGDFVSISGDDYGWRPEDYTHWMPLPEPPAAIIDKAREGGE